MIHFSVRNIAFAALAASAVALGSCSESESALPAAGDITMRLSVDTGTAPGVSRAGEPDYFEGSSGDFEKVRTLRVIILRGVTDGNHKGTVEANRLVATNEQGYPTGNLEFKVRDNEYKRVYLIANEASIVSPLGKDTPTTEFLDSFEEGKELDTNVFADWTASAPGSNPNISGNLFSDTPGVVGLPMTEWFDVPVLRTSPGRTDGPAAKDGVSISVHLFMTRAAAKASFNVKVSDDYRAKGSNITAIRLNGVNFNEYVFPRDAVYQPQKLVTPEPGENGIVNRYITSFKSYPRSVRGGSNITLQKLKIPVKAGTDFTTAAVYFPESKFEDADGRFTVEVLLDGDAGNTQWLKAQPLVDNILNISGYEAVARNTHLRIEIGFGDNGSLTWQAIVAPYNSVELKPGFGI